MKEKDLAKQIQKEYLGMVIGILIICVILGLAGLGVIGGLIFLIKAL